MRIVEGLGGAAGILLAPWVAVGSFLRGARLFHPEGVVCAADVIPLVQSGPLAQTSNVLAGSALVRLSSAIRRNRPKRRDVLGIAVRFRADPAISVIPSLSDQDMLFATFRTLPAIVTALLTTRSQDFLANNYYAILPFNAPGLGRTKWRLVGSHIKVAGEDRYDRLLRAVSEGAAVFRLEVRKAAPGAIYEPVAEIHLRELVDVNQAALLFHPYRAGRGIVPVGFFQAMRLATYPASYLGRTLRARVRAKA
jgi:hypothetical protein